MVRITYITAYYGHPKQGVSKQIDQKTQDKLDSQGIKRISVYGAMVHERRPMFWYSTGGSFFRKHKRTTPFENKRAMIKDMTNHGMTLNGEEEEWEYQESVWDEEKKVWITTGDGDADENGEWASTKWSKWEYEEEDGDEDKENKEDADEDGDEEEDDQGSEDEDEEENDEDGEDEDEDSEDDYVDLTTSKPYKSK